MKEIKAKIDNPLSDLISDEIYELLDSHGLIDEKAVRDYQIRKKFKQLRASKISAGDAIDTIREDRKSTRLNSSHIPLSRMPSSA